MRATSAIASFLTWNASLAEHGDEPRGAVVRQLPPGGGLPPVREMMNMGPLSAAQVGLLAQDLPGFNWMLDRVCPRQDETKAIPAGRKAHTPITRCHAGTSSAAGVPRPGHGTDGA